MEILVHRIVWSLLVCLVLVAAARDWQWLRDGLRHPAVFGRFVVTALLLAVNWLVYIWANNNGHIIEASLGYFITPLVNVLLGLLILHERLRPGQFLAVAVAAVGVSYLIVNSGGLIWISFSLALSFGFYGLLRKTAKWGSLQGLTAEMGILFVPAMVVWAVMAVNGSSAFASQGPSTTVLLAFSGVVTAVPLLLFASGARQVPLTTLGILQYIAPTMQFAIGILHLPRALRPDASARLWHCLAGAGGVHGGGLSEPQAASGGLDLRTADLGRRGSEAELQVAGGMSSATCVALNNGNRSPVIPAKAGIHLVFVSRRHWLLVVLVQAGSQFEQHGFRFAGMT